VLGALLREVPWHGPVYLEAFQLEEACEDLQRARLVVRRGLANIPRCEQYIYVCIYIYIMIIKCVFHVLPALLMSPVRPQAIASAPCA
jgi:hypothetical protein